MCLFSIAKYLLFAFNFVLWLGGAAVLGVGIWLVNTENENVDVLGVTIYKSGAYVLIAAGSVALLLGFLGCCGALKENTCLLGLYFGIVLALVIAQVVVAIWALANFDDIDELVTKSLDAYDLTNPITADAYVVVEKTFECCGKTNRTCEDWQGVRNPYNPYGCECNSKDYPDDSEICKPPSSNCTPQNITLYAEIFTQSCDTQITNWVINNMKIIAGIGMAIGLLEILGLLFSWCMYRDINESRRYA